MGWRVYAVNSDGIKRSVGYSDREERARSMAEVMNANRPTPPLDGQHLVEYQVEWEQDK
jgi:hypothetical protein